MATPMTDQEFTELALAAWPGLYRTAYLMLGDHQLAEDLTQIPEDDTPVLADTINW